MKKILSFMVAMLGMATAQAYDYPYLAFETTGGTTTFVSTEGLELSISGTTLTAGTETFTLSELSKMYFSTTNEVTGIEEVAEDGNLSVLNLEQSTIYDLQGRQVAPNQVKQGVYVVKSKQGTYKVNVK